MTMASSNEQERVPVATDSTRSEFSALYLPVAEFSASRIEITYPQGATIAEIVAKACPGISGDAANRMRVVLLTAHGSEVVEKENWRRVRPKVGVRVIIRTVPGGNNAWRSLLMIVVAIAATALGQLWVGGTILGLTVSAGAGQALIAMGVSSTGVLLINSLSQDKSS